MTRLTEWMPRGGAATDGVWCILGADTAEALSMSGYDFVGLDAQHGRFDDAAILDALRRIPADRTDIIVRVPANDAAWIGRVLDAGARGVIVPLVNTAAEAEQAARAARYPAVGGRSWGQLTPSWGAPELSVDEANRRVVVAVMVETVEGLANVDAITAVPGVDMVYVGPFDMSIGLGMQVDELLGAGADGPLGAIVAACRRNDVIPAAFAGTAERAARLAELGFEVLSSTTDQALLAGARSTRRAAGSYA